MINQHVMRLLRHTWLFAVIGLAWLTSACNLPLEAPNARPTANASGTAIAQVSTATATETIPPNTPLATLTPSKTLRPPPTFEPPTPTQLATMTPTVAPTATLDLSVSIPNLNGAETATPTSEVGCEPRKEWKLRYTVVRDDALSKIADLYGTTVDELVKANCLKDKNMIVIGQELRVPGTAQPVVPYKCEQWEVLTPLNGTQAIPGNGSLTFNWRGPRAAHNLIRIFRPDGSKVEFVLDLRQNETIDLAEHLPQQGWYSWYVYPLDANYAQIPCQEGGPWTFLKAQAVEEPTLP
ncbi:MAG: LysM peptidoglycan-binding domain-containing protein [Anaerolineae bacterium]|nr:LysM peptidoglycan-binding domain-containing protein [Anaerolineae bacterium]